MDEEDLRLKISQLAGQINRRKNESISTSHENRPHPYHPPSGPYRGQYSRPSYRGRPVRGRGSAQFRNLTLINAHGPAPETEQDSSDKSQASTPGGGVTIRAGNTFQWKNAATYEKDMKVKTETRVASEREAHRSEKAQVRQAATTSSSSSSITTPPLNRIININGIQFQVTKGGSKLIRVSNDLSLAEKTPKETTVNGVLFKRTKHGNLLRAKAVSQRTTKDRTDLCPRFTSTGTCFKGKACSGIHDGNRTAICPTFLRNGSCPSGDECDLSHILSPERLPSCTHFLRGNCTNPTCPYSHVSVAPSAPICRPFALMGYCKDGQACGFRHLRECPDYFAKGTCRIRHCNLPHIDRAGHMRKLAANKTGEADHMDVDDDDLSSEDELYDRIDSDDVDSDDFEEPEEVFATASGELSDQQDYVGF